MKILLAGLGFKNHQTNYNLNVIVDTICKYRDSVDLILFGEAFLQGFDSLSFRTQSEDEKSQFNSSKTKTEESTILYFVSNSSSVSRSFPLKYGASG